MKKPYIIIYSHTSLDGTRYAIDIPVFKNTAYQYQRLALHTNPKKKARHHEIHHGELYF